MPDLFVDAFATYRLVRLAQLDSFPPARYLRELVDRRATGAIVELYECPWCLSMYVALGAVALRRWAPRAWRPVALALAYSAACGLITEVQMLVTSLQRTRDS